MRIPEIETADPAQIKALQEVELQKLLSYVMEHSGYYQRVFKAEKRDVKAIKTLEDLALLPFTTKEDLQKHNTEFLCVDPVEIIDYVRTSGTQGEPVTLALTDRDLDRLAYNEAISFACAGIQKEDVLQLMTTIDRQFMAGMAYFLGARKLGAGIIRVGSANPEMHWDSILHLKPSYLIAVPSFLLKMIEYGQEHDIDLNATSIKAALCIGEPIREDDLRDNALAKRIKNDWNIELYSTYASTEMSTAFTECSEHQGGHHHPELVITEIINEEGKAVSQGELGELVITNLGVEAMPLIRFRTGDMVRAHHETCPCGRSTMRLGPIVGRKGQMIKYRGTTLYPQALANALHNFEEIETFAIELRSDHLGLDEVTLKISSKDTGDDFIESIRSHFQAKLRVVPQIEFHDKATIHSLLFPGGSRKPVIVTDQRR